ncbi:unnamed protein product [Tilletia controversa]|nr:unnamed protein product [Tilletia controversa]
MSKRTRAGTLKAKLAEQEEISPSPSSSSSSILSATTTKKKRPNSKPIPTHSFQPVTDPAFTSSHRVPDLHPKAEVFYCEDFVTPELADGWKDQLMSELAWYRPTLRVYGRDVVQSRQIAGESLGSSSLDECGGPFPPLLTQIAAHLTKILQIEFNHVFVNLYEDGTRYIGKHRDNKENLCIASLSLGAERRWIMERVRRKGVAAGGEGGGAIPTRKEWTLANGSLLVMQGDTQQLYTHEIPKETKIKDMRISLTFRQLLNKE